MKTLLIALFAVIQASSAFASVQMISCSGKDDNGENVALKLVIINPSFEDMLGINGPGAGNRAKFVVGGKSIPVDGINVSSIDGNSRNAINFSGVAANVANLGGFSISVPKANLGAAFSGTFMTVGRYGMPNVRVACSGSISDTF